MSACIKARSVYQVGIKAMSHLGLIRETRRKLAIDWPPHTADKFAMVTLPEGDCDALRDLLIGERLGTVIEIGLAYGSSALAIGEALISVGGRRHLILDPFQHSGFKDAGWEVIRSAQLDGIAKLIREQSQIALPRLVSDGVLAHAAFVDGSHLFHNVFVDLFFLQQIVQPGGLIILEIIGGRAWQPPLAISRQTKVGGHLQCQMAQREGYMRCGCRIGFRSLTLRR